MEKGLKAFFYDYKYYLFPDDCASVAELKSKGKITAKRLKEDRCMAPDFIYESIAEETLEIEDPNRLFEVYVNLYTGAEYDEILAKQVHRVCPGCDRYCDEDDPSLDGHHREISLDGICYEREDEKDYWDFATCADVFWHRISERLNELAVCIDKNDQKKIKKIVGEELKRFCPETTVYGTVYEGKYTLCFQTEFGYQSAYILLLDYLAGVANWKINPVAEAGWKVLSYRPAGTFRPKKELKSTSAVARLVPTSGAPFCFDVVLYHPRAEKINEKKAQGLIRQFYETMCARVGEEKVWMVVNSMEFSSEKAGLQTTEEIATALKKKYEESFGESAVREEDGSAFPAPIPYGTDGEAQPNALPYRGYIQEGVTRCSALSFLDKEELKEKPYWTSLLSFAYLYIPRRLDDAENPFQTLGWYLANGERIPEPLRDPEETRVGSGAIGFADCGEHGFLLDFFVASEKKFFRMLRTLAPLLKEYRAKAVMVNKDGAGVYECGYEFTPVEEKDI